jgi:hypothetical protein
MGDHWISIDYEWIIHGYPKIVHGSQGALFVTTRHAIQVERISTIPISTIFRCASLRIFGFPGFHHPPPQNSDCILFHFWRHRRQPMISLWAAWATNDHFGGILSFRCFSRNFQIKKHRFFSVSRDSVRRSSGV